MGIFKRNMKKLLIAFFSAFIIYAYALTPLYGDTCPKDAPLGALICFGELVYGLIWLFLQPLFDPTDYFATNGQLDSVSIVRGFLAVGFMNIPGFIVFLGFLSIFVILFLLCWFFSMPRNKQAGSPNRR
jgi:hypothetical protein